jgi:seryl-tRNA synthetase
MSGGVGGLQTFELARAIDDALAADVAKQGVYVSPHIRDLRVREDMQAVTFHVDGGADLADVHDKVARFVHDMVGRHRNLERRVLARHVRSGGAPSTRGVYDELVQRRWILPLGRGQVGLAGPALAMLRALDGECEELAHATFGAVDEAYPTLIPAGVLGRCGYFASFPQAVTFATHLVEDYDSIEKFRAANALTSELVVPERDALPTAEACLVPAVCYHCYQALEGRTLEPGGHVATAVGRCVRYESSNIVGLDRLWDFTMREVIFVGARSVVAERRDRAIDRVAEQLARWDLDGTIETANDPFFPTTYASKTYYQRRSDLKFELRLAIEPAASGESRTLACGSFNLHEDFFGKTFSVSTAEGEPAHTGCVGWGLERWVLACFAQHGFHPDGWPTDLRGRVFR